MHFSPESLLELFSPRRVAAMAALAMRPRLQLPALPPRRLLRAAASCRRRLLLPDAPCRRLLLQPHAAACCCSRSLLLRDARCRGVPHGGCRVLMRAAHGRCMLHRSAPPAAAQPRAPPLAGEEVFLVTVQHLEFNISTFYAFYFNISFV